MLWPQSQVSGLTKPQQPPLCSAPQAGPTRVTFLAQGTTQGASLSNTGLGQFPPGADIHSVQVAVEACHRFPSGVLNTALALTRSLATSRRGDDNKDDSSYLPDIYICQAFAMKTEGSKQGVKLTGCLDAQRRDHHQPLQFLYFSFKSIGKK